MIRNFFKVAFRSLWRSKGYSAINLIGLAIGMASAIIILLWLQNEISYDQFHEKKDRIYEAWNKARFDGKLMCWNTTPKILARTLERDLPEVEQAVRVNHWGTFLFNLGEKKWLIHGSQVDSNFLDVFSFPMIKGNPKTALKELYSIVITEKMATTIFGKEDPMGKTIRVNSKDNLTVTGILKNLPNDTRFDFEWLTPWSYLRKNGEDDSYWGNNSTTTYVLLKQGASIAHAQEKMKVIKQHYDDEAKHDKWEMFLYPLSHWRLYSNFENGVETGGRISFVRLFTIVASFILLIACINFMNLSTARSERRAKEVGIRKVVGAQRSSLITQFIGESVLLAFIAGVIAIGIVQLSIPGFNQLTDKTLYIPFGSIYFWFSGIAFVLFTGLLAGSYPAFFLSAFKPVSVLKGTFKKVSALVTPRKVLVVLQFTFAIILIICTIIVTQQIDYAKNRQTGYNRSNLIYFYLSDNIEKKYTALRTDLVQSGIAASVTKISAPLTQSWSDGWGQDWEGKDPSDRTDFRRYNEDGGLGKTAGLTFVAGRDIDPSAYPNDSLAMVINESALKVMKFKNPIGQFVKDNGKTWHVVGVIKDFILESPYEPTKPMLIYGPKAWFNIVLVKLNKEKTISQYMDMTQKLVLRYDPNYLFVSNFVDEEYARKFENEKRTGILSGLFAGLTILISCLGLFGLATYMASARIKEIGVRKVLGASITNIATLLSKDFIILVLISLLIATPVAWLAMHAWLESYPYRIAISALVFIGAGLLSILIALLTVSFQAIKAAMANPAKSLRTE